MKHLRLILCLLLTGCAHGLWHDLQTQKQEPATIVAFTSVLKIRHTGATPTPTPFAMTAGSKNVTSSSFVAKGVYNAKGTATTLYFKYGTTTAYGALTPTIGGGSGTTNKPFSATISGLVANTTYHFAAVASNSSGTNVASGLSRMTSATPSPTPTPSPTATPTPTATPVGTAITGVATNISPTSLTLNGAIGSVLNVLTFYNFDYGATVSYGTTSSTILAGNDGTTFQESLDLTGLSNAQTINFRINAITGGGVVHGANAVAVTTTPTPTPTATPTPDPTPTTAVKPHGVLNLYSSNPAAATSGDAWVSSTSTSGVTVRYPWLGRAFVAVVTTDSASDTFVTTLPHGLAIGTIVGFKTTGTLPGNISATTPYYVISSGLTTIAFKVSLSAGGSAVDLTSNGTGRHSLMIYGVEGAGDNLYNFANMDSYLTLAVAHSKFSEIYLDGSNISTLEYPASWLQTTAKIDDGTGNYLYVPWIEPYRSKYLEFIAAFGARYNGTVRPRFTIVVMGAPGGNTQLTKDPNVIAQLDAYGGLPSWSQFALDVAAAYHTAFPDTTLCLSIKNPYGDSNSDGSNALNDVVAQIMTLYPNDGLGNVDLYASSNPGSGLPNILIKKYSLTHSCGFQLRSSTTGFAHITLGCDSGVTAAACLATVTSNGEGIQNSHGWQEIYVSDTAQAGLQTTISTANSALTAIP